MLKNWTDYFKRPVPLNLYIMHTGFVHMSGNIHFNKKDPRFSQMPKDSRFNPVFAHLVVHPEKGYLLLDTGLHPSFARQKTGNFGPLLGRMVKTRAEKGKDVVSQLAAISLKPEDIGNIILSHLHLDHPSSLQLFSGTNVRVYATADELEMANRPLSFLKGCIRSHLNGFDCRNLEFSGPVAPFDEVCDFFGDGSVFVVRTPGHTPGHVSVLLNAFSGPILLTFDAAHRKDNLDYELPPIGDFSAALKSLNSIKEMSGRFSQMRIIYGHDPDQLETLDLLPTFYG